MDNLIPVVIAFAMGGILKGATGAGAPIIAVPLLAILYDVQFAVAVFVVPNIVSNVWQSWKFRHHHLSRRFAVSLAVGGGLGAVVGSVMLAWLPSGWLMLLVAIGVFVYIGFRLLWRDWKLPLTTANRLALPVGVVAGILQGSTGISAPASITFLNAMRLDRLQFVATISTFFVVIGFVQLAMLGSLEIVTSTTLLYGCLAVIPLAAFMPVGSALVRYVSKEAFDRLILGLLFVLALKLVFEAL